MAIEAKYYTETEYAAMFRLYIDEVLTPRGNTYGIGKFEAQRLMYLTTYFGMDAVMCGIREEGKQGKVNTFWLETWLMENKQPADDDIQETSA